LFAAIDPPADAVADLEHVLRCRGPGLRWVPSSQWHVTTAFYGEVSRDRVEELKERLGRGAARTPPLSVAITGGGCFPRRPNNARVLWAGLTGEVDELARLADRCVAAGRRSGIAMERRRFRAHLTLARSREATDMSGRLAELWSYAGPTWTAATLQLVHSTLGAEVRHETIAQWPLGSAGDVGD
jgi:2'-5' RNA ligase